MKRILFFTFAALLMITLAACGGKKATPEQLIVGDWTITEPAVMTESGMSITFSELAVTYSKDKTAKGKGKMSMSGAGLPVKLEMDISTESTWALEGDKLTETITNADVKMTTDIPGMPDMSKMMGQQMKSQSTTSTIVTLDKKNLVIKDDKTGMQMAMKRK